MTVRSAMFCDAGGTTDRYGSLLANARDKRIDADYARTLSISQEDAEQWLARAEDAVDTDEAMLFGAAADDPAS